jgi:serine/threonine-protein kinase
MEQPTRIGSYEIAEVLGEGAMGTVYIAHQQEPVQRTVALKVLKATDEPAEVLDRYETERQALAVMDHPSVARVFDAGVTDDGNPYVVMERVEGSSILRFSDEHRLTIRERLTLFAKVCHAVQHAHQKGVIHRDLKPEHILVSEVDGRPMPKIIDFGIATAADPEVFVRSRSESRDSVIGTPAYMSPEQINGYMSPEQINGLSDIDTRSDIYSLGIILYELLVGAAPFDVPTRAGWGAVAARIMSDPPTPTARFSSIDTQDTVADLRRTTPEGLRRELHDDIDWIVRRAMAKERTERYETAHEFALELERHLANQPVHAHPAGVRYAIRKFVQRNRIAVGSGTVIAAGVVLFAITTSVQAAQIERAHEEAEARRSQAETLIDFMLTDLYERLEPLGRLDILAEVGDEAVDYFVSVPPDGFTDAELASLSQAMYQIGDVRRDQGRLPEAGAAFEASLGLARALYDRDPADDDRLFELGQAEFYSAERYYEEQRYEEAFQGFSAYRDISNELVRRDPENLTYQLEVGFSHTNVGGVLHRTGDLAGALVEFEQALEAKRRVAAADPGPRRDRDIGQAHNFLGAVLRDIGRLDEAQLHFEADVEIKERLVAQAPQNAPDAFRLVVAMGYLADLQHARGDVARALDGHRVRREYLIPLVENDPSNLRWARNLSVVEAKQAHVLADTGEYGEAGRLIGPAVERLEELVDQNPDQPNWRADFVRALSVLASVRLMQGDLVEADRASAECLQVVIADLASFGDAAIVAAERELVRAEVLAASGRTAEAVEMNESAVDRLVPQAESSTDFDLLTTLATALLRLDRADEARSVLSSLEAMGYAAPEVVALREASLVR